MNKTLTIKGVIYASQIAPGAYYLTGTGYLVRGIKVEKSEAWVENYQTGNEIRLNPLYILRILTEEEVTEEMKKQGITRKKLTGNGDGVEKTSSPRERQHKEGSFLLEYAEIEAIMKGGKEMKVVEIKTALKKEYRPVYMTLRQMAKNGLVKLTKPGTFVLLESKKKAEPKPKAEPKKKSEKKVEKPAEEKSSETSGK